MKITRVEAVPLRLPEVNERCDGSQETLVVKVHSDEGLLAAVAALVDLGQAQVDRLNAGDFHGEGRFRL